MILRFDQIVVAQEEQESTAGSRVAGGLSPSFRIDATDRPNV
jgi:hypothetical protein